jgi:adenine-specific DNA-methyltransferase
MRFEDLVAALGEPYWTDGRVALYHEDAVEALTRVPEDALALTVTSPPYNIGKEYEEPLPLDDYVAWSARWIAGVHRATAPDGAFWLNLGYVSMPGRAKAVPLPYLLWDRIAFYLVQEIVWNYGAGVAARASFSPRNEKFLWYVKNAEEYIFNLDDVRDPDVKYPNQKKNGKLKCNPLGKNPTDVWTFPKVTSGANRSSVERTSHPAQFPEAVIERIVKACSDPGDIVLDPFMGSGTTGVVARRLDRYSIGFETNEGYLADVAIPRLLSATHQLALA